jgi:hypothetical protein
MALNTNTSLIMATTARDNGGKAVVKFINTGSILVAKGAANSDIVGTNEVAASNVIAGSITGLWWTMTTGKITVARGANTVAVLGGTGYMSRENGFTPIGQDPAANLAITFDATTVGNGTVIVELNKLYGPAS